MRNSPEKGNREDADIGKRRARRSAGGVGMRNAPEKGNREDADIGKGRERRSVGMSA